MALSIEVAASYGARLGCCHCISSYRRCIPAQHLPDSLQCSTRARFRSLLQALGRH